MDDPVKLLDLPSQTLDKIIEVLARVGIEPPALVLQLFLLVLVLVALHVAARAVLPDPRNAKLPAALSAVALALLAIGILWGMVSQLFLPDRLIGRVAGSELAALHVDLLDFRGRPVSTGGTVDTISGDFIAYYSPAWNGRARTLRISSTAGCKTRDHVIGRSRLVRNVESTWEFACEK
jgi:hypothetical protein